ncbi:hypothetical protein D3C85_1611710 [compost metagenome]
MITTCCQLPLPNSHSRYSTVPSISTWQTFCAITGRRLTRLSTLRWPFSRTPTMAARKVIQIMNQRDSSSDTLMPLLKL